MVLCASVLSYLENIFSYKNKLFSLQRIISAPQFNNPVIIINIELIVIPARANIKKRRRVQALSNVSTLAPKHPSLLKKLQRKRIININREIIKNYRLRINPIVALPVTPPISNIVEKRPALDVT